MLQSSIYVGVSAQIALLRRLDTLAVNLANQGTVGYRAEQITFASVVSNAAAEPVDFVSRGSPTVSREPGEHVQTGNPLDVAVDGGAWLGVETPAGRAYTRDGRLQMMPSGLVRTVAGHQVLDAGGAPLQINPQEGPPEISRGGVITQAGKQIGALGLFHIDPAATLERLPGGVFRSDRPGEPQLEAGFAGVMQGFIEKSNANPILEMTKLISVQRAFDSVSTTVAMIESSHSDAIKALGST